jgi:hypothetical protein
MKDIGDSRLKKEIKMFDHIKFANFNSINEDSLGFWKEKCEGIWWKRNKVKSRNKKLKIVEIPKDQKLSGNIYLIISNH